MELGSSPAPNGHASYLETKTFASLDGLRALAIVAVVWHHTHDATSGLLVARRGFLGVDLFFVISGFLIVTLLLRERRRTADISLRSFYARRFLRIFPPYYAMLIVVAGIAYIKRGGTAASVGEELPFAFAYLSNLVPMHTMLAITWSLSAEEQFYLLVPALEKLSSRLCAMALPAALLVASLPALGAFPTVTLPGFFRETTFVPILLGVGLAHLLDAPRGYRSVARVLEGPFSPLVAAAIVALACTQPSEDLSGWPRLAIQVSLLVLVASCVVREKHALLAVLAAAPFRRIGISSYGIYLYHMLVMHLVGSGLKTLNHASRVALFAGTLLATWGVAEISYRWFESPLLRLKSRFAAPSSVGRHPIPQRAA